MMQQAKFPFSRIAWVADQVDYDIASFRYRSLIPAYELSRNGIESIFAPVEDLHPADADVFVFVKTFNKKHVEFAKVLHRAGRPFILDICDNIFFSGYDPKRNVGNRANFIEMATNASRVVVTGNALAKVVRDHLPHFPEPIVIPDASFTLADHLKIFDWFNSMQLVHRLKRKRFLCSLDAMHRQRKDTMQRWASRSIRYFSKPKDAVAAAKRLYLSYLLDRDTHLNVKRPKTRRKLIWFGKHGTSYGKAGMQSLCPIIPHLIEVNKVAPIKLTIVSNNRRKYRELFGSLPFPTRYKRWSHEVVFRQLMTSDAFLMPNETDEFSSCKSANRAVMSLAMGVPVITTWLESIEPLAQAVVMDNWQAGLQNYLLDATSKEKSLAAARDIIDQLFVPEVIGQQWEEVLSNVHRERAR